MFDVEKIEKLLLSNKGLLCFNDRHEFKLFCEDFLVNHINKYALYAQRNPYTVQNTLQIWDELVTEDYKFTLHVERDEYAWGFCYKEYYQSERYYCNWPIYNCNEFIQSINVSKDNLMDFLKG